MASSIKQASIEKAPMKQVILKSHVVGNPAVENFSIETTVIPDIAEGQVLIKTLWLSLDPLIRFALDEVRLTGRAHVELGEVIYGGAVSQVIESRHPNFAVGNFVEGRTGWQEYAAVDPAQVPLRKVNSGGAPLSTAVGVLGMPGQTAHACMVGVGRVQAGETVVISAAAGVVGSTAGQIGKILGARVVGIAGSAEKCDSLVELGFDACVNYKSADFAEQLAAACPEGVDVYIDNVGGDVTWQVLPLLKYGARMPVCGYIAYYGVGMEGPGPDRLPGFMRTIMSKGLEVRGFGGFMVGGEKSLEDIAAWIRDGLIQYPETIVEGIEQAPWAFASIFGRNSNIGKLLVHVAEPD